MPTYEYKCPKCNNFFDVFGSIVKTTTVYCPKCNTIMNLGFGGGSGIHFKGSGFYETDYKGK